MYVHVQLLAVAFFLASIICHTHKIPCTSVLSDFINVHVYVCCVFVQALSVVLSVSHFPFVIEVACWAAKREFLKLEKWITDKIKEHHVS